MSDVDTIKEVLKTLIVELHGPSRGGLSTKTCEDLLKKLGDKNE